MTRIFELDDSVRLANSFVTTSRSPDQASTFCPFDHTFPTSVKGTGGFVG
jgi:hypothetical protein